MDALILRSKGPFEVGFTIHLRGDDPARRATTGVVMGTVVGGAPKAESWVSFGLFAERRPRRFQEEAVRLEPSPAIRDGQGDALRRCASRALAALPKTLLCDPQDREGLTEDEPDQLMVFSASRATRRRSRCWATTPWDSGRSIRSAGRTQRERGSWIWSTG